MKDFLDSFEWHSSIGIDANMFTAKKTYKKLDNSKQARTMFITAGENLLIHKTTNALWKFSKDKKTILPVFDTDILTEDDLKKLDAGEVD